jgi:serine/threonine-protein kinase
MGPVNVIVDDDELTPGTMVGEYRVEGQLGEGGMGTVYAAIHPVIAKRVAIKVLHPALSVNREAVERFVQEARSVNQIGHPNIVDIFAFGTLPDGRSYFVMERLHGRTLREAMTERRLTLADTMAVLETITLALEAAHDCGVVHRDLKPDNIYLVDVKNDRPIVKLLDFGIAKLLGDDSTLTERTRTGNLLGTPGYISPEQARGYAVDHRTDIYALGAVAFEMITGSLPFPADNGADMIAKHLHSPPPSASGVNPHVPPGLDKLLRQLLSKDADRRPTLAQTRDQLRAYRGHTLAAGSVETLGGSASRSITPPPSVNLTTSSVRRTRAWAAVAGAVLVVISGGVVFMAMRGDDKRAEPPSEPLAPAAVVAPRPTVEPIVEPIEQPIDKPTNKLIDKSIDKPSDKLVQPRNTALDKPGTDESIEATAKPVKATDKPVKAADKPVNKAIAKPINKGQTTSANRPATDRPTAKPIAKPTTTATKPGGPSTTTTKPLKDDDDAPM